MCHLGQGGGKLQPVGYIQPREPQALAAGGALCRHSPHATTGAKDGYRQFPYAARENKNDSSRVLAPAFDPGWVILVSHP